jgi:uncharacterized protein
VTVILTSLFLIYVGFFVGIVTGLLGLGGGWIVSPTLNFLGYPGIVGVGTSLAQMVGTTIFSSRVHLKHKTALPKLAAAMALPLLVGTLLGFWLLRSLQVFSNADSILRYAYMLLLGIVGIRWLLPTKENTKGKQPWQVGPIYQIGNLRVPVVPLTVVALLTGVVSGTLGVGGGFMMVPFICWLLNLPVATAVGTSVFAMIVSSSAGAGAYFFAGNVDFKAAAFLLIGSLGGTYFGSKLTAKTSDKTLRKLFSFVLLATATSLACMQFGYRQVALGLIFVESVVFLAATLYLMSKQGREHAT